MNLKDDGLKILIEVRGNRSPDERDKRVLCSKVILGTYTYLPFTTKNFYSLKILKFR